MFRSRIILFSMGLFFSTGAAASELDFNVSDEALAIDYMATPTEGGAQGSIGFLRQEDDIVIADLGLHLVDNAGTEQQPVTAGLGGKLFFLDTDVPSGGGIAIGAFGRFNLSEANRVAVAGSIHYAPEVTTFSDVEGYWEFDARIEYEVLRNASIYLGYRKVEAEFEGLPRDVTLDSGAHFGMHFRF
ncbi:MAG: YfaZ family outer membrane protein [Gammaproteobacteria bacterium]|nr:YfaZ family outer membrane protein [Gammaproteobacteria bacterium]